MSEEPSMIEGSPEVSVEERNDSLQPDPAASDQLFEVNERLSVLGTEIGALNELASAREQTITRLHDEVQQLRKGELAQAIAPLIRDLINLHDQVAATVVERETAGGSASAKDFAFFRDEIIEILARYDVERLAFAAGDAFDPAAQRAITSVPIDDPALDRRIAIMRRPAFRTGMRIIRFADVDVYRLTIQQSNS